MRVVAILLSLMLWSCGVQKGMDSGRSSTIKKIYVDKLGMVYTQSRTQIDMLDKRLNKKYQYVDEWQRTILDVDVQNPQEIAVLLKGGALIILDNTLSIVHAMDLSKLGMVDAIGMANAQENAYWILDPTTNRIVKINTSGQEIGESSNLYDAGIDVAEIQEFVASGRFLVLAAKDVIYIMDAFGTLLSRHSVKGCDGKVELQGEDLLYRVGSTYYTCGLPEFHCSSAQADLAGEALTDAHMVDDKILGLTQKGELRFYELIPVGVD